MRNDLVKQTGARAPGITILPPLPPFTIEPNAARSISAFCSSSP